MVELVPALLRQELARLAADDQRLDGRGRWESREVSLKPIASTMPRDLQRSSSEAPLFMLV